MVKPAVIPQGWPTVQPGTSPDSRIGTPVAVVGSATDVVVEATVVGVSVVALSGWLVVVSAMTPESELPDLSTKTKATALNMKPTVTTAAIRIFLFTQ